MIIATKPIPILTPAHRPPQRVSAFLFLHRKPFRPHQIQNPPIRTPSGRAREGRSPLAPRPRGGVGEQRAPRSRHRKQSHHKGCPHRRKPKFPPEQPRESARGGEPFRTPSPKGGRGAERPTPALSETKSLKNSLHRRKLQFPPEQPRESARGSQPSRTPSPEGV